MRRSKKRWRRVADAAERCAEPVDKFLSFVFNVVTILAFWIATLATVHIFGQLIGGWP